MYCIALIEFRITGLPQLMISTQLHTHTGLTISSTLKKKTNVRRILKIVSPSVIHVPVPAPAPAPVSVSVSVSVPTPTPTEVPVIIKPQHHKPTARTITAASPAIKDKPATTDYCDPTLFTQKTIHRSITVPFHKIARSTNISEVLKHEMSATLEGKCSIEGYICPGSIIIIQNSCGRLNGGNVIFDVTLSCLICLPNEQEKISCVVKTITQAGIRAVAKGLQPGAISPIEVFLSRDMNMNVKPITEYFMRVKECDTIVVEIIGRRFVLNDTHVTIIGILSNK